MRSDEPSPQSSVPFKAPAKYQEYDINNPSIWCGMDDGKGYVYSVDLKGNISKISCYSDDPFTKKNYAVQYYEPERNLVWTLHPTVTFMPQFQRLEIRFHRRAFNVDKLFTRYKSHYAPLYRPILMPSCANFDSDGNLWGCWATNWSQSDYGSDFVLAYYTPEQRQQNDGSKYKTDIDSLGNDPYLAMAFDHLNNLWAHTSDGRLLKLNKLTGKPEKEITTGLKISRGTTCGGVIDKNTDIFYLSCAPNGESTASFFSVNLVTGETNRLNISGISTIVPFHIPFVAWKEAPAKPESVTLNIRPGELGGSVMFVMPSKTHEGKPLGGSMEYRVTANGKTVASGTSSAGASVLASFRVDSVNRYDIDVYAVNEKGDGVKYSEERFIGAYEAPHAELFPDHTSIKRCMTIDNNGDGQTWFTIAPDEDSYSSTCKFKPKADKYFSSEIEFDSYDDWLILPPVRLQNDKAYKFTARIFTMEEGQKTPEILIAPVSENRNVNSYRKLIESRNLRPVTMNRPLDQPVEVLANACDTISDYFGVEETGVYNIAVRNVSKPDAWYHFWDAYISEPLDPGVPNLMDDCTVVPDPTGATKALISFRAATKDLGGKVLTDLTKITIMRDSVLFKTIDSPEIGKEYKFEDILPEAGNHTYFIRGYSSKGEGRTFAQSLYVGMNTAVPVTDLEIKETANPGEVTISWKHEPKTVEGFPINPELIHYQIVNCTDSKLPILKDSLHQTSYTVRLNDGTGFQSFAAVGVYAVTAKGQSDIVVSPLTPVGKNIVAPYTESFANKALHNPMGMDQSGASWQICNDKTINGMTSSDGDNGFAACASNYQYGQSLIYTAKIDLSSLSNPRLAFSTYNITDPEVLADLNILGVWVRPVGQKDWEPLRSDNIWNICGNETDGWSRAHISLEKYKGQTIQIGFQAVAMNFAYTLLDDIRVEESVGTDLVLKGITAPAEVERNKDFSIEVPVFNNATDTARNYTVVLYKDGNRYRTFEGEGLRPGGRKTVVFDENLNVTEKEKITYYAEVLIDDDENEADNITENIEISLTGSALPAPSGLKAALDGTAVSLNWIAPAESRYNETVTDSFEDYTPWQYDKPFGDWTTVDADNTVVGGMNDLTVPGMTWEQTKNSFWILDEETSGLTEGQMSYFRAHSGKKFAASFYCIAAGCDDWLITPELSGRNQTIRFWIKSYHPSYPETVEFLFSTTDTKPESFVKAEIPGEEKVAQEWTEYAIELPEGTKYFAIRKTTSKNNGCFLFVDDFTYEPKGAESVVNAVLGYNVYRDGVKMNADAVAVTSWKDEKVPEGDHEYCVSAVYAGEESLPSNRVYANLAGIGTVGGNAVQVKGGRGYIDIYGAEGNEIEVTSAAGVKIYSGVARSTVKLRPLTAGIYMVRAGSMTQKVIVK